MTSSWLVGSVALAAQTVTIDAAPQAIAAGTYYLRDATAALSLLDEIVVAMTAAGVAAPAAVLLYSRKIKLSSSGVFTVTWPVDAVLRDLLGFSGNLAAASSYTATAISPLLWSPGKGESPQRSPLGVAGHRVYNTVIGVAEDGTTYSTTNGYRTFQEYRWTYVPTSRVQTSAEAGGEFARFFAEVLIKARWKLYRAIAEDDASTTAVTWPTAIGPYFLTPESRTPEWEFSRSAGFELGNCRNDVSLKCHVVPEVS